jgi:hypothetical protein
MALIGYRQAPGLLRPGLLRPGLLRPGLLRPRWLNSRNALVSFRLPSNFDARRRLVPRSIRYNSSMPRLKGLGNIVAELRAERAHLVNNLRHVDAALAVLGKLEGGKFATVSRRSLSATARRKIAAAQRARWAKVRAKQGK